MSEATPVAVNILDREFLIGCTAEERAGLIAAAHPAWWVKPTTIG